MHIIPVYAFDNEKLLARASLSFLKKNHFAEYVSFPLENDTNFNYLSGYQNILNFKPVVPLPLNNDYDLIIRTIAPVYERTPLIDAQGMKGGIGNINPTFFISPSYVHSLILGIGPTLFIPTTTNAEYFGQRQWSAGPELAVMFIREHWMAGILTYNVFDFKNNQTKSNEFSFEYLIAYTFENGWYFSTNPTITANWNLPENQRWIVPFGLGTGKAFYVNGQGINLSAHMYYNAIRPAMRGPDWQLQLEMEWLFPALG